MSHQFKLTRLGKVKTIVSQYFPALNCSVFKPMLYSTKRCFSLSMRHHFYYIVLLSVLFSSENIFRNEKIRYSSKVLISFRKLVQKENVQFSSRCFFFSLILPMMRRFCVCRTIGLSNNTYVWGVTAVRKVEIWFPLSALFFLHSLR